MTSRKLARRNEERLNHSSIIHEFQNQRQSGWNDKIEPAASRHPDSQYPETHLPPDPRSRANLEFLVNSLVPPPRTKERPSVADPGPEGANGDELAQVRFIRHQPLVRTAVDAPASPIPVVIRREFVRSLRRETAETAVTDRGAGPDVQSGAACPDGS